MQYDTMITKDYDLKINCIDCSKFLTVKNFSPINTITTRHLENC